MILRRPWAAQSTLFSVGDSTLGHHAWLLLYQSQQVLTGGGVQSYLSLGGPGALLRGGQLL